jgi:hypothetical protein
MKYIKLFEDFVLEEDDPFAALGGLGGDKEKKPKEDPIEKIKKEKEKEEEEKEERHDDRVEKKIGEIEDALKDTDLSREEKDKIVEVVRSQDRVKIHNLFNDLIYKQQGYEDDGNKEEAYKLTKVKELVDDLDKSFTQNKMI